MNNLALLYSDELRGFAKSKVMLALWLGLPALALVMHYIAPSTQGMMPLSVFTALILGSIGGTLGSAMLAVSIIHEKTRHVYDLFLIRPLARRDILVAKFFAVFTGLLVAGVLSIGVGLAVDYASLRAISPALLLSTLEALVFSLSITSLASAIGVLIGVVSGSVLLGVILVIYGGNQLVSIVMLPYLLQSSRSSLYSLALGVGMAVVVMSVAVVVFDRQQY